MSTLHGPYFDRMVKNASSRFLDLVIIGERIENCLKNGKIHSIVVVLNGSKKPYSRF